jgi:hypothetical protein
VSTDEGEAVRSAARNNGEWCAAVCRSHGVPERFEDDAWLAGHRTPPFYPDAVTLVPAVDGAELVRRIDTDAPGASVKDSFADLELPAGFRLLFDAQWVRRPSGPPATTPVLSWSVVDTPAALHEWAAAWDDGEGNADVFRPALLDEPDVRLLTFRAPDGAVAGGAAANRSADVVGLSNVFGRGVDADEPWAAALQAVAELFPSLPVVGYEHGPDLATVLRHGFRPVGPLRVWTHEA